MPLWKVAVLSFTALITMVNPLAVVPSFIALTGGVSRPTRASVAFVAALSCVIVLAVFLIAGNYLFAFFGITVPAFQIMGGILFLTNALRTLVVEDRRQRSDWLALGAAAEAVLEGRVELAAQFGVLGAQAGQLGEGLPQQGLQARHVLGQRPVGSEAEGVHAGWHIPARGDPPGVRGA